MFLASVNLFEMLLKCLRQQLTILLGFHLKQLFLNHELVSEVDVLILPGVGDQLDPESLLASLDPFQTSLVNGFLACEVPLVFTNFGKQLTSLPACQLLQLRLLFKLAPCSVFPVEGREPLVLLRHWFVAVFGIE
jgi:hypothetical protein